MKIIIRLMGNPLLFNIIKHLFPDVRSGVFRTPKNLWRQHMRLEIGLKFWD